MSADAGLSSAAPASALARLRFHPALAALLLLSLVILIIAVARMKAPATSVPTAAEIETVRVLRFDDMPDGAVAAIDAGSGQLVQRFEGEQGFLRGTLRALTRERRLFGVGAGQPFELILWHDGRLTLHDPATGMRIALESFGATNTGVFARLLP